MKLFKRIIIICFLLSISAQSFSVFAVYEFPREFYDAAKKYGYALNSNDYYGIIEYGEIILDIMEDEPYNADTLETKVSRCSAVAKAYGEIGDYDKSEYYYQMLYELTENEREYHQIFEISRRALMQLSDNIIMYTDGGVSPNYNAINEKGNGVLFGLCADGEAREYTGHESMVLTYQELGQDMLPYNVGVMEKAYKEGLAVQYALNCPNQGADIRDIYSFKSHLNDISKLLKKYPSVPVYLRFAAEFDVWSNDEVEADDFVEAFRYVSDYFKERNENVAIVWCPTQASSYELDINDFYPGDDYVDWVGISSYSTMYHLGNPYQTEFDSMIFKSGINSSPVKAISDIVETYGDRKPIMISESGVGHYLHSTHQDFTDFALYRLKEYYNYIPMVYSQVKLIAYFDQYVSGTDDYRLSENQQLLDEYVKLTKGSRFIQDKYNGQTGMCYQKIYNDLMVDSVFPVSTYADIHNDTIQSVTYYLDDKHVGMSNEIPFTVFVNASQKSGYHTLKAVAKGKNGDTLVQENTICINGTSKKNISVEISGDEISFDQDPVIYNDRTMVPMRKIFEELGAGVSWDGNTRTVTGKKGDRTVKVTLDNKTMYVNNQTIQLDTPPIIISDRTLVPVRAVAEGLGCDVQWDSKSYTVYIEPKVFKWSEWSKNLPSHVNEDMYYIEEKEKEYFESDYKNTRASNFVREDVEYGSWGNWQKEYISENDNREVQTRTQYEPKNYLYAHYCTGYINDAENRYKTWKNNWHSECTYHELGWFSHRLDSPPDNGAGECLYKDDGTVYRCNNTCYRWYVVDETGGDYTEYRSRKVYRTYIYWEWSDWSEYDDYKPRGSNLDIEKRTVYRYKEK